MVNAAAAGPAKTSQLLAALVGRRLQATTYSVNKTRKMGLQRFGRGLFRRGTLR